MAALNGSGVLNFSACELSSPMASACQMSSRSPAAAQSTPGFPDDLSCPQGSTVFSSVALGVPPEASTHRPRPPSLATFRPKSETSSSALWLCKLGGRSLSSPSLQSAPPAPRQNVPPPNVEKISFHPRIYLFCRESEKIISALFLCILSHFVAFIPYSGLAHLPASLLCIAPGLNFYKLTISPHYEPLVMLAKAPRTLAAINPCVRLL